MKPTRVQGNTQRANDLREGEKIDDDAIQQRLPAAVAAKAAALAQPATGKK